MASPVDHPWSEDALFAKAWLYVEQMETTTPDDWRYGLWSSLALEFLARAALARVSPVLLADSGNWQNQLYALDKPVTAKKFSPKSTATTDVLTRLQSLLPTFTTEMQEFCSQHVARRNTELHSGEPVFAELRSSTWLPQFYEVCKALLESIERSLADLFEDDATAEQLIESHKDEAAKAVQKDVNAHSQVWENKTEDERNAAVTRASRWATRKKGHVVTCPACKCDALLHGTPTGAVSTTIDDWDVVQRQTVLPSSFECVACGLKITGLSKLNAAGLGDTYTSTATFTPADFFDLYTEDDLEEARGAPPEYEPDFNE